MFFPRDGLSGIENAAPKSNTNSRWVPASGLKPGSFFAGVAARLNMLRKKALSVLKHQKERPSGAEARHILFDLAARLKPCPCYKAL